MPDEVIDAIDGYLRESNANLGGAFATSRRSGEVVDDARAAAARFLGCSAEEVVFGANMTTLNFALSRALGRELAAGDEIVVTKLDHDANVVALARAGARPRVARALRGDPRRHHARLRAARVAALGADARGRVPVGVERGRNAGRRGSRGGAGALGGRARLGRRRPLRPARADRRERRRGRRPALLAVQVLRAPPGPRVRAQGAARALAALQGPPRAGAAGGGALRDRDAARTSCSRASAPRSATSSRSASRRSSRTSGSSASASSRACRTRSVSTACPRWTAASPPSADTSGV